MHMIINVDYTNPSFIFVNSGIHNSDYSTYLREKVFLPSEIENLESYISLESAILEAIVKKTF